MCFGGALCIGLLPDVLAWTRWAWGRQAVCYLEPPLPNLLLSLQRGLCRFGVHLRLLADLSSVSAGKLGPILLPFTASFKLKLEPSSPCGAGTGTGEAAEGPRGSKGPPGPAFPMSTDFCVAAD